MRANIFYSVDRPKDFMNENLGMEAASSMQAVCVLVYDIKCLLSWNVHGADTPSIPTWNHMFSATVDERKKTEVRRGARAASAGLLTAHEHFG